MRLLFTIFLSTILFQTAFAGGLDLSRKSFQTKRLEGDRPQINGNLNEEVWTNAEVLSDFIQNTPIPNVSGTQRTEVRMLYDDEAIYVAARNYKTNENKIFALAKSMLIMSGEVTIWASYKLADHARAILEMAAQ